VAVHRHIFRLHRDLRRGRYGLVYLRLSPCWSSAFLMDYTDQFDALYALLHAALIGGMVSAVCILVSLGILVAKSVW
jgi:hypothetical protein